MSWRFLRKKEEKSESRWQTENTKKDPRRRERENECVWKRIKDNENYLWMQGQRTSGIWWSQTAATTVSEYMAYEKRLLLQRKKRKGRKKKKRTTFRKAEKNLSSLNEKGSPRLECLVVSQVLQIIGHGKDYYEQRNGSHKSARESAIELKGLWKKKERILSFFENKYSISAVVSFDCSSFYT